MGEKDGQGFESVEEPTSSICPKCWSEHFPGVPYPEENNRGEEAMKGITLIDVVIVIAIIAIVAVVLLQAFVQG